MNQQVPQGFVKRLNETIAWCVPRVNVNDPKYCLRSQQLRPDYKFDSEPKYDVDIWAASIQMISQVVKTRSQLLMPPTALSTEPDIDLAGGRLLVHFLDESNNNGVTADITSFFLDNNDTPPWDTWVGAFIPKALADQRPDEVPVAYSFLISWVPPAFHETVNEATESECVGMLMWADAPRREESPVHSASIPMWLQKLST